MQGKLEKLQKIYKARMEKLQNYQKNGWKSCKKYVK